MKNILYILLLFSQIGIGQQLYKYNGQLIKNNEKLIGQNSYYPLYIIIGTSTCGRTRALCYTGGQCLESDSAHWSGLKDSVKIYNQGIAWEWQTMNTGVNTKLINPLNSDEFGFETSFGKNLSDYLHRKVFIYKLGVGSSTLQANWMPDQTRWTQLCAGLDSCLRDAKENKYSLILKSLITQLGENDATNQIYANNFSSNYTIFMDSLANRINYYSNKYNVIVSKDYKIIVNRILHDAPAEPYRELIRSTDSIYCKIHLNTIMLSTDQWDTYDGTHYNSTGEIGIGIDLFNFLKY